MERTSLLRQDKRSCSTTLSAPYTGLASFGRTLCPAPSQGLVSSYRKPSLLKLCCSTACLENCSNRSGSNLAKPGQYFVITLIFHGLPANSLLLLPELLHRAAFLVLLWEPQGCLEYAVWEITKGKFYKQARVLGETWGAPCLMGISPASPQRERQS